MQFDIASYLSLQFGIADVDGTGELDRGEFFKFLRFGLNPWNG
jgi:hypothetical protein